MDLQKLETVAASCDLCNLHEGRINPVFAKGNPNSKIMICGMVPAHEENQAGIPFVGRAGKLLDDILLDVQWSLDNVYITNIVKCCLSPGISLKQPWIDACLPYLITQIGNIRPKVIITLGKDAACGLLGIDTKVALGRIRKENVHGYGRDIKVVATYHPSYLLRGGGKNHKNYLDVVEDFLLAEEISLDN
jgi:DNA polymerase